MRNVEPKQRIVSLPLRSLLAHPANPNRMSNAAFNKLARHIERTGQYEPIVVRPHPQKAGAYQILNGVHRVRALKRTGQSRADCVVFDADDTQALVYLVSLNQLTGRSNVKNKSRLMAELCKHCDSKQLAQLLPDSKTAIDKLNALANHEPMPGATTRKPALTPMTFFLSDQEQQLLAEAFEKAVTPDETGTRTEKRLRALHRIAQHYLQNQSRERKTGCI